MQIYSDRVRACICVFMCALVHNKIIYQSSQRIANTTLQENAKFNLMTKSVVFSIFVSFQINGQIQKCNNNGQENDVSLT